ncbi:hypothetical protein HYU40_04250 [Candidatus Woesearchaeota archaeon]|nr:hypothetical protein [Candidatus Woesearchaeota archaeon]
MVKLRKANKQGIFRTLEALIAIFITFLFLIVFVPMQRERAQPTAPQNVLASLRDNDEFRNCVIQKNETCINQSIGRNMEDSYDFKFNLSDKPYAPAPPLPQKRVYANSMYLAGNTTNSTTFIVRLYFWTKA